METDMWENQEKMRRPHQLIPKLHNSHYRPLRLRLYDPLPSSLLDLTHRNSLDIPARLARQHPRISLYAIPDQETLPGPFNTSLPHHCALTTWLCIFLLSTSRQRFQSRAHGSSNGFPHASPWTRRRLHCSRRRSRQLHRQTTRRRIPLLQSLPLEPLPITCSCQR